VQAVYLKGWAAGKRAYTWRNWPLALGRA